MKKQEWIKVNFPKNQEEFANGNGEGMWVIVDAETKADYDTDKSGGRYTGVLDNEPFERIGYKLGDTVEFEMRGTNRPVAFLKQEAA